LEGRGWQIVCSIAVCEEEDVPEEVHCGLPGIAHLVEFNLEPVSAPSIARKRLDRAANALARDSHGLVEDPQSETVLTPRGVERYVSQKRPERFSLLTFGWWFLGGPLFTEHGVQDLLLLIRRHFKEALPRRYGLYEPPQFKLEDEGLEHLVTFLTGHLDDGPVLYAHRPVAGVSFACTQESEHPHFGFRCSRIEIEVEASVLVQPGWESALRRFWHVVVFHLRPFYAEVRTLDGFLPMGATYGSDMHTAVHPIRSWFWRGVPAELGHALALGTPYVDLWPDAARIGKVIDGFLFLDSDDWQTQSLHIEPPSSIRQAWMPGKDSAHYSDWKNEYPPVWPFDS